MKRYFVQTLGCQMNVHDSSRMEELLVAEGYQAADAPEAADLIVVNTCSVRDKAEQKLMSLLGRLRLLKEERGGMRLAVAGCVAQQEGERLVRKAPFVDLVIGPDNLSELPGLLRQLEQGSPALVRTEHDLVSPEFLRARPLEGRAEVTAFVTTMKGCDERCTFCIVPTTRGPERYRDADSIVAEVASLAAAGVKEVTLLGQTVNSWHEPEDARPGLRAPSGSRFAALLRRIAAEVPALARLRYTSPHPRHVTPALIAAHAELPILPAHVHLPAQSGSDRMLRRMSRRYTRAAYLERARALQGAREGLTLSTDLIVGFPGESDDDFEQTIALVREVGFVAAFCFKFSPRPGTPALGLGDDVPEEVKDARLRRLFEVLAELQGAHLASLVGTRTRVLVEGPSEVEGRFMGRSERGEIVHLEPAPGMDPVGQLVEIEIHRAYRHSLFGAPPGIEPRAEPPRKRALPLLVGGAG